MANYWKGKNVFITGANGFLGSHITSELVARGAKPVVLIYEDNPGALFDQEKLGSKCVVVRGDICDLPHMEKILKRYAIDTVLHLAAQAIVDQAIEDPLATFEANIKGTWNILEACKKNPNVKRIIVASSDKAYGEQDNLPYREHIHGLQGSYPYEVSKVCADLITQSFYKTFGLPVCITRCANLYGPGDLKLDRLVPNTIRKLNADTPPIIRDTGASLRDYLYVGDAAEAYLLLAEKMDNKKIQGEVFNFATNKPFSVAEVIKTISALMGKSIAPTVIRTHGMEIRHQYASYNKAKKLLGWKPTHTFKDGLKKTIPWYIEYLKDVTLKQKKALRR